MTSRSSIPFQKSLDSIRIRPPWKSMKNVYIEDISGVIHTYILDQRYQIFRYRHIIIFSPVFFF